SLSPARSAMPAKRSLRERLFGPFRTRRTAPVRKPPALRRQLEPLEDRTVPAGASLLKDVGVALVKPSIQYMTAVGSTVYFNVDDGAGHQLGKYDGNSFTEIKVGDFPGSNPLDLTAVGSTLYFEAYDSTGYQLWKYDGTSLTRINVGTYFYAYPQYLTAVGSTLYFDA